MKTIHHDELYNNLGGFLKSKGIELTDGCCPRALKAGCELLADAVNLSQRGIQRTKKEVDRNLELLRQAIHEMTAPRPPKPPGPASSAAPPAPSETATPPAPKRRKAARNVAAKSPAKKKRARR